MEAARRAVLEERRWLARVSAVGQDRPVGAAFAIDERHLVTCAHVVEAAQAAPGGEVRVEFPLVGGAAVAEVLESEWVAENGTAGDVAVLRMREEIAGIEPAPLCALRSIGESRFVAYGFPDGYPDGTSATGAVGPPDGLEWVKLEVESQTAVSPGFSGAAVWSDDLGAVVGIVITRDGASGGRVAFAIPMSVVAGHSRVVDGALPSPLDLDPDTAIHWGPRSRGVTFDRDSAGWLFRGREEALSNLVEWLGAGDPPQRMRVVTGTPGAGKSAVLARLATTSDRTYRSRIRDLDDQDPGVCPEGTIDVTFHAKDRTVGDFASHVGLVTGVVADRPEALVHALDKAQMTPTLVIDALDESAEPRALCRLLNLLAAQGSNVLVGCRAHLVRDLTGAEPMYLDREPWLDPADIESYVRGLLPDDADGADAAAIAEAADGNFLVARLVAEAVSMEGAVARPLPRTVPQAFEALLEALPDSERARDLLLPLAYARGDGLPRDLWQLGVGALRRPCSMAEIEDLLASPAASFLVTDRRGDDGPRHRLFHAALAETLRDRRNRVGDARALWEAWAGLPGVAPPSDWSRAPAYLLRHAPDHARQAGRLPDLISDVGYLLHGDMRRLLVGADGMGDGGDYLAALRLTVTRGRPLGPTDRAFLLALAARQLGLAAVADELNAAAPAPDWRPAWAHGGVQAHLLIEAGHGWVTSLKIARSGSRDVVIARFDRSRVRAWDLVTGAPVGASKSVEAPPDGGGLDAAVVGGRLVVVVCDSGGKVIAWDLRTGEPRGEIDTGSEDLRVVAMGQIAGRPAVVTGSGGIVQAWDLESGERLGAFVPDGEEIVSAVALEQQGDRVLVLACTADGAAFAWDVEEGERVGGADPVPDARVTATALGRLGDRPVVATAGVGAIRVRDFDGDDVLPPITNDFPIGAVALDVGRIAAGDVIACGEMDGDVTVVGATAGRRIGGPTWRHGDWVRATTVGTHGGRDVVVSGGDDGTVRVWDATDGGDGEAGNDGVVMGHATEVWTMSVAQVNGEELVASGDTSGRVALWDVGDGRQRAGFGMDDGMALAVVVGERATADLIAASSTSGSVYTWNPFDEAPPAKVDLHDDWARGLALGESNGRPLAVSGDDEGVLVRWDPFTGEPLGPPLTTSDESGARRWIRTIALQRIDGHDVIVLLTGAGVVQIRDLETGELLEDRLLGDGHLCDTMASGELAADERVFAIGRMDGVVSVWSATTLQHLEDFQAPGGSITSLSVGAVGGADMVISGSDDGRLRLWTPGSSEPDRTLTLLAPIKGHAHGSDGSLFVASGSSICRLDPS